LDRFKDNQTNTIDTSIADEEAYYKRRQEQPANTETTNVNSNKLLGTMQIIENAINALDKKFALTVSIVSIAGYIIISATGNMKNVWADLRYIFFLGIVLVAYKFLRGDTSNKLLKNWHIVLILLLSAIIIFDHREQIYDIFQNTIQDIKNYGGSSQSETS